MGILTVILIGLVVCGLAVRVTYRTTRKVVTEKLNDELHEYYSEQFKKASDNSIETVKRFEKDILSKVDKLEKIHDGDVNCLDAIGKIVSADDDASNKILDIHNVLVEYVKKSKKDRPGGGAVGFIVVKKPK